MTDITLRISQLANMIKAAIDLKLPATFYLSGEIQRYELNKDRRHIFFELVEHDEDKEQVKARMNAVIFEGSKSIIAKRLKEAGNPFTLRDGMELRLLCKVDFYPPSGQVSVIILDIDPHYTIGLMMQARAKTLERLRQEDLLERNKRLPLPLLPLSIGLITGANTAAFNDFISELRNASYPFKVYLYPTSVQGTQAEIDIPIAIKNLERNKVIDIIAIIRGGGSRSDLACFDGYKIASSIARCRKPVLTGLGHEIDISVSDLVSNHYEKTPTAAAGYIILRVREQEEIVNNLHKGIVDLAEGFIYNADNDLERIGMRIGNLSRTKLAKENEIVYHYSSYIAEQVRGRLQEERYFTLEALLKIKERYKSIVQKGLYETKTFITSLNYRLNLLLKNSFFRLDSLNPRHASIKRISDSEGRHLRSIEKNILFCSNTFIGNELARLELYNEKVLEHDPANTLKKGYVLVRNKLGRIIKSSKEVQSSQEVGLDFHDGQVKARIEQ